MIARHELELKNEWWINSEYEIAEVKLPKRDLFSVVENNLSHPLILNIVGLRRVGKSTILRQLIGKLLTQKINPQHIFYFLFDYASQPQKASFLDEVLATYFKEVLGCPGLSLPERVYVLLDEIQYIEDWQSVVKKYYDLSGKKIKFIVTGSQSVLLKNKSRESLAGRIFDFYLPPLSFREFMRVNREVITPPEPFDLLALPKAFGGLSGYNTFHGQKLVSLTREYITTGQFPEIRQLINADKKQEYIVESVIGKVLEDCVRIFHIEKPDEFKLIARHILTNTSSLFEQINLSREVGISRLTLDRYLKFLADSYLYEILYRYHKSPIKRGRLLKKIYTPCVNFTCALHYFTERHVEEVPEVFGKIVENAVFNVLKQKYPSNQAAEVLSFWRQGQKEIDFLVSRGSQQLPIEVKFSNSINLKALSAITDYMVKKKISYGVVVTREELNKKEVNGQTFYYIPYYLILLMV